MQLLVRSGSKKKPPQERAVTAGKHLRPPSPLPTRFRVYKMLERLPATAASARRLGLVTIH